MINLKESESILNSVCYLVAKNCIVINNFWGNLETNILHFNLTGYKTRTWFQLSNTGE